VVAPFALVLAGTLALGQTGPSALLEVARRAKAAGDVGMVDEAMRGWATIADTPQAPEDLAAEAARALAFSRDAGRLQLFATKLPDRLHLGVRDPAGIVQRVDVFLEKAGERTRLRRLEDEGVDRFEYALDPKLAEGGVVAIEAVATKLGGEIVVKRIELLGSTEEGAIPIAPNLEVLEKNVAKRRWMEPARPNDEGAPIPWWIIAGGLVAAALAGAAIWQETR
jgi:hypothetical protein